ncbi:MAG: triphosphoribosyl-dephospho-CoA synthase [Planctomycetota bacterium]
MIRNSTATLGQAVRWACILEATSPKPGNVHPGASFHDLGFGDFIAAAEALMNVIDAGEMGLGELVLGAVVETHKQSQSNVNLGIILLIAPLVVAHRKLKPSGLKPSLTSVSRPHDSVQELANMLEWRQGTQQVLDSIDVTQSRLVFQAISLAKAGGMELPADDQEALKMDVNAPEGSHDELLLAMSSAANRDWIAREYATGFESVFHRVVPLLDKCIESSGDLLVGIRRTLLCLLATEADSLIARKNGRDVAEQVRQLAAHTDPDDENEIGKLDVHLRSQGNRLNPGTTADLIVAGLFVWIAGDSGSR